MRKFKDSNINIPFVVLQEIDKHKNKPGETGLNARVCIRMLDELRQQGNLVEGVQLSQDSDSVVKVILHDALVDMQADDIIIEVAKTIGENQDVLIISNDINLRVKASLVGVASEEHSTGKVAVDEGDINSGIVHLDVDSSVIDDIHTYGKVDIEGVELEPNCFVHLRSDINPRHTGIGRVDVDGVANKISVYKNVFGISSRNLEQACALDLLMDSDLPLVSLIGLAGSGKTLMALASALELILNRKEFQKLVIVRPPIPMGKDIGYLPGDLSEKLAVWMGPIVDNFEVLLQSHTRFNFDYLIEKGLIEIMPPTYIRGRSIMNSIMIVDEAQGLNQHEMKTIVTRMHESSKLVVTGDVRQIDSPKLSAVDNGLSYLIEKFRPYDLAGHVTLVTSERSSLAALAAEIM